MLCYESLYGLGKENQNVSRLNVNLTLGCGPYSHGGTFLSQLNAWVLKEAVRAGLLYLSNSL